MLNHLIISLFASTPTNHQHTFNPYSILFFFLQNASSLHCRKPHLHHHWEQSLSKIIKNALKWGQQKKKSIYTRLSVKVYQQANEKRRSLLKIIIMFRREDKPKSNIDEAWLKALTWLADFGDHAGRIGRAERDICTPVCRVRLYCLSLWETETTKFLIVRETPRPQSKQKKSFNLIFYIFIMRTEILSLVGQALFFIFGVYLEKFFRKHFFSRMRRKQLKQTMRIFTCAIMTGILLFYNFKESCEPSWIGFSQCFFITFDFTQIFHLVVANSLLFGWHIYEKFIKESPSFERYSLKNILIAPLLEELLFRASFFRTSSDQVSIFILALIFSISHLHKPIRKKIKGKVANRNGAIGQVIFTFVFGVYSFYFLSTWFSVIPSVILHCYCNFLGPPSIRNDNLHYHIICIISVISYCYLFVSQ